MTNRHHIDSSRPSLSLSVPAIYYFFMKAKIILLVFFTLLLTSCTTLFESNDPYTTTPYVSGKNAEGETVHARREYRDPMPSLNYPDYYSQSLQAEAVKPAPIEKPYKPLPTEKAEVVEVKKEKTPGLGAGFGFEYAAGEGNHHLGINLNGPATDWLQWKGGFSIFVSKDVYAGFDLAARAVPLKMEWKPFAGVGIYVGDTKSCKVSTFDVDVCEKKFLNAGYGELGIAYKGTSVFYRDYNITRAGLDVPTNYFLGIGFDSSW